MRYWLTLAFLVLTFGCCDAADFGVQGQVKSVPAFGNPPADPRLLEPYPIPGLVVVVFDPRGHVLARQKTDTNGHYRISLSNGSYVVQAGETASAKLTQERRRVTVAGGWITADFVLTNPNARFIP